METNDLIEEIRRYSVLAEEEATQFHPIVCEACQGTLFQIYTDDQQGGCGLMCVNCETGISVYDSADYMEDVIQNSCTCLNENLQVVVAVATLPDSEEVKRVYVGGHCPECQAVGVYSDWNEA